MTVSEKAKALSDQLEASIGDILMSVRASGAQDGQNGGTLHVLVHNDDPSKLKIPDTFQGMRVSVAPGEETALADK